MEGKNIGSSGMSLILEERRRQIEEEGFAADHDDHYRGSELEEAASVYLSIVASPRYLGRLLLDQRPLSPVWPWKKSWLKPFKKEDGVYVPQIDMLRCLVKAGALFLAASARVLRMSQDLSEAERLRDRAEYCARLIDTQFPF